MTLHIHKARLDALTDGVFAVAMTLLVIDLKLPESFHPTSNADLLRGVGHLGNQMVAYVVSFFVLGIRWTSVTRLIEVEATIDRPFIMLSILHLFLISCMPFSTMVVGRYIDIPAAVWLYGANTAAAALVMVALVAYVEAGREGLRRNEIFLSMIWLLFAVALSVAASFFSTALAMWLYALNVLPPLLLRRILPQPKRRR
jgi:TMEM175 potassium channel family protein